MTYSLNRALFVEDGAALRLAETASNRSRARRFGWHRLDADRRFAVIESALKPANDLVDGYPLAL